LIEVDAENQVSMRSLVGAMAALLLVGAAPARAQFVGDVSVADGLGTVSIDERVWLTRDGGQTLHRVLVRGHSALAATVLPNGLGYARARDERLWRTTDGGRTWRRTPVKNVFQVTATSTSAWALRNRGKRTWIVRSEDGGRTWHSRRLSVGGSEGPAVQVAFADAADGVISGLRPSPGELRGKPFLLVTQDGGRTWTERLQPCTAVAFKYPSDVQWLASGTLWLICVGAGGAGAETIEVLTSVDAGRTFTLRSRAPLPGEAQPAVGHGGGPGHYQGFTALTGRRAFMDFGYGVTVTDDGGRDWRQLRHLPRQPDGGAAIVSVDGKTRYLALGQFGLWRSLDAGAHWERLTSNH
jgi:photosystem II stability/assembly factor-like uncharacterized protein